MKTTVEIDEERLKRVMKLGGLKTRKAAIDYALCMAEKAGRIDKLLREAPSADDFAHSVATSYDIKRMREREKPGSK